MYNNAVSKISILLKDVNTDSTFELLNLLSIAVNNNRIVSVKNTTSVISIAFKLNIESWLNRLAFEEL